jgi:hypothetical protein
MTHGVIQFMPFEIAIEPNRGLDADERAAKRTESALAFVFDEPAKVESVGDWPQVQTAILRSGLFVLEAETPLFTALLRFDPKHPDTGDYEIHRRRHGGVEKGRIEKIIAVPANEADPRLSMLTRFSTRYAITTVGAARPHPRLLWRVGLNDIRIVDKTDDETMA